MESKDPYGCHQERNNKGVNNGSLLGPCGGASRKTADVFFSHITNFVSQRHSVITRGHQFLEPRVYLNVEKTDEQRYLLQPTAADVLVGNLLEDSLGQKCKEEDTIAAN